MRIWDLPPQKLCRNHLLGEHRELHAIWSVITLHKKGYSRHPETLRWNGKLAALYARHELLVKEMHLRGFNHHSALDKKLAIGNKSQTAFVHSPQQQIKILKTKKCACVYNQNK
ncbi:MAG: pyrimidine dimer DNA glycosylase [Candidatus Omnitrophica bacterium]|nr:pyrimidine dimer DNA glycosylase [Candidatus Omnitrophota bacterium]